MVIGASRLANCKSHEENEKKPENEEIGDYGDIEYFKEGPVKPQEAKNKNEYPYLRIPHSPPPGIMIIYRMGPYSL